MSKRKGILIIVSGPAGSGKSLQGQKLAEKYGESMPIIEQVNLVLFENKNPGEAVQELMMREGRAEASKLSWQE